MHIIKFIFRRMIDKQSVSRKYPYPIRLININFIDKSVYPFLLICLLIEIRESLRKRIIKRNPFIRGNPQGFVLIFSDTVYHTVPKFINRVTTLVDLKVMPIEPVQTVLGSHPDKPFAVLKQAHYRIM